MRCQGLRKSNEDILIGWEMPSVYGLPPERQDKAGRLSAQGSLVAAHSLHPALPPLPFGSYPSSLLN